MQDINDLTDLQVVARTLDGEAGNQGYACQQAVMNVIQNRTTLKWQGETTERGVCLHRLQFDCWLSGPDRDRILADDYIEPAQCMLIAQDGLAGLLSDITAGATNYFDNSIPPPSWTKGKEPTFTHGTMSFYNLT